MEVLVNIIVTFVTLLLVSWLYYSIVKERLKEKLPKKFSGEMLDIIGHSWNLKRIKSKRTYWFGYKKESDKEFRKRIVQRIIRI